MLREAGSMGAKKMIIAEEDMAENEPLEVMIDTVECRRNVRSVKLFQT
jgi:hypothetical protein